MSTYTPGFVAASLLSAATLAVPSTAAAVTFPSLTTIYLGTGIRDNAADGDAGIATVFNCTNVSGVSVDVRFLILAFNGAIVASHLQRISHGDTDTVSTDNTAVFSDGSVLNTGSVNQGAVNIESTESAVFCTATMVDDARGLTEIPLVRVNPHPGTME
jgi:hypothetical protein